MHGYGNENRRFLALQFAHVALPDDATECDAWEWHKGAWRRFFVSREWQVGSVRVTVGGEQTHEGDVERWLRLCGDDELPASAQQELMQALADARALLASLSP